jgi:hypothetical protein
MTRLHPAAFVEEHRIAGEQTRVQERHAQCMAVAAFVLMLLASVAFQ